jgi:hypothetical protein
MGFFVVLTEAGGRDGPLHVNLDRIEFMKRYDAGPGYTTLHFRGDDSINVRQTPQEIVAMMPAQMRAGIS